MRNYGDAWGAVAHFRHEQILSGNDITFTRLLAPQLVKLVSQLPKASDARLLEVGCGTGVLTGLLAKEVAEVCAIDPADECILIAQEHTKDNTDNITFDCTVLEDFEQSNRTPFDVVVAHMVLHVLAELELALDHISNLLRPAGKLIFSIPHPCFFAEVKSSFSNLEYHYMRTAAYEVPFVIKGHEAPIEERVPYFHRSLGTYFQALAKSKLWTHGFFEPWPDPELMKMYRREWKYPGFIIWVCEKGQ